MRRLEFLVARRVRSILRPPTRPSRLPDPTFAMQASARLHRSTWCSGRDVVEAHFGSWKKPETRQAETGRSHTNQVCGSKRCPSGALIAGCGWSAVGCGEFGGDPADPAG